MNCSQKIGCSSANDLVGSVPLVLYEIYQALFLGQFFLIFQDMGFTDINSSSQIFLNASGHPMKLNPVNTCDVFSTSAKVR